jgi:hypothetical protein
MIYFKKWKTFKITAHQIEHLKIKCQDFFHKKSEMIKIVTTLRKIKN